MNKTKGLVLAVLTSVSLNATAAKDLIMQLNCDGHDVVFSRTAKGNNLIVADGVMYDTSEGTRVVKANDGSNVTYQFASRESNGKSLFASVYSTEAMLEQNKANFIYDHDNEKVKLACDIVNHQIIKD